MAVLLLLPVLSLCSADKSGLFRFKSPCEGNQIPWPQENSHGGQFECEDASVSAKTATKWLRANMPDFDVPNEVTLFGEPGGVDGLDIGLASLGTSVVNALKGCFDLEVVHVLSDHVNESVRQRNPMLMSELRGRSVSEEKCVVQQADPRGGVRSHGPFTWKGRWAPPAFGPGNQRVERVQRATHHVFHEALCGSSCWKDDPHE